MEQTEQNFEQIKIQVERIRIGTERSYNHIQVIDKSSLIKILQAYSDYDKSIEYCQGMNYLVGFMSYVFPDNDITFKAFLVLIYKYKLMEIYKKEMPLVFFSFFAIDILLNKYLPELQLHLKLNNVNPQHYASSCIITILTNLLEQSKGSKIPQILIAFWDSFLLDKWKGIFKSILFLVENVSHLLTEEKFENTIIRKSEMNKFEESKDKEKSNSFKKNDFSKKITNEMIN